MKLRASAGFYLTQVAEVSAEERKFVESVYIGTPEEATNWHEVTESEKEAMLYQQAVLDIDKLSPEFLDRLNKVVQEVPARINDKQFTPDEALAAKKFYPTWGDENAPMGKQVDAGFRFNHSGELYEVIKPHTLNEAWVPGEGTESLYLVVQKSHAGTSDDPIPWQLNMKLELDKYYTEDGVKYLCVRSSEGLGMSFCLTELVKAGYVQVS